jgi:hypothetical protein
MNDDAILDTLQRIARVIRVVTWLVCIAVLAVGVKRKVPDAEPRPDLLSPLYFLPQIHYLRFKRFCLHFKRDVLRLKRDVLLFYRVKLGLVSSGTGNLFQKVCDPAHKNALPKKRPAPNWCRAEPEDGPIRLAA